MKLSEVEVGQTVRVHSVSPKDSVVLKTMCMGLIEPTEIKVLSKAGSTIEVQFEGITMAISEEVASRYGCVRLDK